MIILTKNKQRPLRELENYTAGFFLSQEGNVSIFERGDQLALRWPCWGGGWLGFFLFYLKSVWSSCSQCVTSQYCCNIEERQTVPRVLSVQDHHHPYEGPHSPPLPSIANWLVEHVAQQEGRLPGETMKLSRKVSLGLDLVTQYYILYKAHYWDSIQSTSLHIVYIRKGRWWCVSGSDLPITCL